LQQLIQGNEFDTCTDGPNSISTAFYDFTNTLNAALKALDDHAGLLTEVPAIGGSVTNPLQECKGAFDDFVSAAAELCVDSARAFFNTGRGADEQFDTVIKTYDGGAVKSGLLGTGGLGSPTKTIGDLLPELGELLDTALGGGGGRRLLRA
jgi:hypothetical protein